MSIAADRFPAFFSGLEENVKKSTPAARGIEFSAEDCLVSAAVPSGGQPSCEIGTAW
jgi:hypothetical protein